MNWETVRELAQIMNALTEICCGITLICLVITGKGKERTFLIIIALLLLAQGGKP